jgi:hypothetical protein
MPAFWSRAPSFLSKIWCVWRWWRRGEVLQWSETAALVSSPRISINKLMSCFFFLAFAFGLSIPLLLAGRGGEEWGGRIWVRWQPERSRGLAHLVFSCNIGEQPRSEEIKPLRWGWISFAPLA